MWREEVMDMSEDCVFCKIIEGELPSTKVYEDQEFLAFRDINAQAPSHVLLVPKKHIDSLSEAREEDEALLGRMLLAARNIAEQEGLVERGYRVLTNSGPDSGQVVDHLHFHILGGRELGPIG